MEIAFHQEMPVAHLQQGACHQGNPLGNTPIYRQAVVTIHKMLWLARFFCKFLRLTAFPVSIREKSTEKSGICLPCRQNRKEIVHFVNLFLAASIRVVYPGKSHLIQGNFLTR